MLMGDTRTAAVQGMSVSQLATRWEGSPVWQVLAQADASHTIPEAAACIANRLGGDLLPPVPL
jgi:hypothetical protein